MSLPESNSDSCSRPDGTALAILPTTPVTGVSPQTPMNTRIAGKKVLTIILAGGQGSRLAPLTDERAKSAVPFLGHYRLIDFVLSNVANSGLQDVWVIEQYLPHSLNAHLSGGRPWDLDRSRTAGCSCCRPFRGRRGMTVALPKGMPTPWPCMRSLSATRVRTPYWC